MEMAFAAMAIFFFTDTSTTWIYTLSLHDALPIWHVQFSGSVSSAVSLLGHQLHRLFLELPRVRLASHGPPAPFMGRIIAGRLERPPNVGKVRIRSEEHTSELQSLAYLVCRLLLEK